MYERELGLALRAADIAGQFLSKRQEINVDSQEGRDIKLSSDKHSERLIIDVLKETGIPILSEECGLISGHGDCCWIIDPLDGTVNYWRKMDELSCVSIALWKSGEPVLGVVNRFTVGQVFRGVVGKGAFLNDAPIYVSDVTQLSNAIIATGFPADSNFSKDNVTRLVDNLRQFKKVRMLGSAATMCVFVASGKVDAYMEEDIKVWDIGAASAIVRAAGGVTDITISENDKCICRCFATPALREAYYAQSL